MPTSRQGTRRPLALAVAALLLAACGGERPTSDEGRGTVIIATAADADFLLPALVTQLVGKQVIDQLFEPLAAMPATMNTLGDVGFQPRLAKSWEWAADSLSITFRLDPRARWHDGQPVRAGDVRFSLEFTKDPAVASRQAGGLESIDSISVSDSLTAVAWFSRRSAEQFFSLVYNLTVMPEHLLASLPRDKVREAEFARAPVGNGRFRFRRWEKGAVIELVADTASFRGRPSIDRVMWSISPDPTALWGRVVNEEADFVEMLRGEPLAKVEASTTSRALPYEGLDYGFVLFNVRAQGNRRQSHPVLGDLATRRALTLAIDRQAVTRNVFDTLAYTGLGPVVRAQWAADTTVAIPGQNVAAAKAMLDSLGWRDADGNGIREKGGRPLRFSLLAPSSSSARRQASVILQAQWKEVGADVTLEDMEFNAFIESIQSGKFDAMMHGLHADPSPSDARGTFGSPANPDSPGSNFGGYSNLAVDAAFDSAMTEFDPVRAKALYQRAYAQIQSDAAAIFLYEPKPVAGISRRIEGVTMPASGWWTTIADWKISPDKRIARDKIPLGAPLLPVAGGDTAKSGAP